MEEIKKLSFELTNNIELEIIHGLVVPKGSKVFSGIAQVHINSNEEALKLFKSLFGIRKKTKVIDEEESVAPAPKKEDSEEELEASEEEDVEETEEEKSEDED